MRRCLHKVAQIYEKYCIFVIASLLAPSLMKIVFLDAITMGDASLEEISALGELVTYPSSTAEEARERVRDADVAILNKVIVDQAFLDAAPKLRLVCEAGTGINNIDVDLCRERGVAVRNVAAYSTDSVAQTAWMHILNLAADPFHYDGFVRDGRYSQNKVHVDYRHPFTELAGKVLGIVGMGAIGQKVASIGKAFGMEVKETLIYSFRLGAQIEIK